MRGQIGRLALGGEQEEAAVLHDELQALDALRGAPTDPEIAILERVTDVPPDQERDGPAVPLDELPEVMVVGQLAVDGQGLVGLGDAHGERGSGGDGKFGGMGSFHPSQGNQKQGFVFSKVLSPSPQTASASKRQNPPTFPPCGRDNRLVRRRHLCDEDSRHSRRR